MQPNMPCSIECIDLANQIFVIVRVYIFDQHNFPIYDFCFQMAGFKGVESVFFLRIGDKHSHIGLSGISAVPNFNADKYIIRDFIAVEIGFGSAHESDPIFLKRKIYCDQQ